MSITCIVLHDYANTTFLTDVAYKAYSVTHAQHPLY